MFASAKIVLTLAAASLCAFAQPRGATDSSQPVKLTGVLVDIDAKKFAIELPDYRIIEFALGRGIRYTKDGASIAPSDLRLGDQVQVDASKDEQGFFTAHEVIFLKADDTAATPAGGAPAETPREQARVNQPLAPAAPDPDDPGPPRLRRGRPAERKPTATVPPPDAVITAPAAESAAAPAPPAASPPDPLIEKARAAAASFTAGLPNYICQQMTTRYVSSSNPPNWKALDVIAAEVAYENGRESYRNLTVNGKKVNKTFEEIGGAWSNGEFGSLLADVFSPASAAEFRFRRDSVIGGVKAAMYDYSIQRENSHWAVKSGSQMYFPAYKGSVWIDRSNGRTLRIEGQARAMPREFPLDTAEVASSYEYTRISGQPFLLPVHAETLTCARGTSYCHKNSMDFRNYRKYAGESNITFEEEKEQKK
jgi:hypothetical protein